MARLDVESLTGSTITIDGRELVAFGGCNYLGLSFEPGVQKAAMDAMATFGLSTSASRETTGNTVVHDGLEAELARFTGHEASILLAEGYTANIAIAQTLCRDHGIALVDAKAHRSLKAAARAAGMQVFEYEHLDPDSAAWLCRQYADVGVVLLTDGVFAADGAIAPIPELVRILPPQRAMLVVDDCHGFCVLGKHGRGTLEHFGVDDPRVCATTTLAKGLGCYGGCVLGRRDLVRAVRERADVYRRSTPIPTPIAAAARQAVTLLAGDPSFITRLRRNTDQMRGVLAGLGIPVHDSPVPVFTFTSGSTAEMTSLHRSLLDEGFFAACIEYPGGPSPMFFRLSVTACHTPEQIARFGGALARHMRPAGVA